MSQRNNKLLRAFANYVMTQSRRTGKLASLKLPESMSHVSSVAITAGARSLRRWWHSLDHKQRGIARRTMEDKMGRVPPKAQKAASALENYNLGVLGSYTAE